MPQINYTVQNLVDEVRSLLDEENVDSVNTESDILPALNRGQDFAFDIYSRKYPEPILKHALMTLTSGEPEYDIPEEVFEDRILKVEVQIPSGASVRSTYREVYRISYRDLSNFESASVSNIPYYYCVIGRKIRLIPIPTGTYSLRIWYLRNPEKLVLPQGRITTINTSSNYVIVDSVGDSLTTESDQLGSYVNVVDGQTGEIKGSLQIQTLIDNRIAFRSSPQRSSVLNKDIGGSLADLDIQQDDYICAIDGICVPYYGRPTGNFLIQFAVCQIRGQKLGGGNASEEDTILDKFEKQVERTWVGRERQMRVQKRSLNYGVPTRRWWYE